MHDVGVDDDSDTDDDQEQEALDDLESSPPTSGTDPAPRRIAPGLRGVVVGPVGVQVPFEVLAVDEAAMTWTWRVRAASAELTLDHSVDPRRRRLPHRPDDHGAGAARHRLRPGGPLRPDPARPPLTRAAVCTGPRRREPATDRAADQARGINWRISWHVVLP